MPVEQRAAARVPCELPLRLLVGVDPVPGTALDISRLGVRFRVAGRSLGVHRLASLVQVARRVSERFGTSFATEFTGPAESVRTSLTPVRIGQRDWESPDVEIGCRIDPPLTDRDAAALGLELPPVGRSVASVPGYAASRPSEPPPREHTPEPSADLDEAFALFEQPRDEERGVDVGWRVEVYPSSEHGERAPLVAEAQHATAERMTLHVPDVTALGLDEAPADVSALVIALDERYGSHVAVKISDGARHVWTGPCSIHSVELVRSDPRSALLDMGFRRPLGPAELEQMGLRRGSS